MGHQSADRASVEVSSASSERDVLASALAGVLEQVREVVSGMPAETYRQPCDGAFMGASLGGHVRHVLDHVAAIVDAGETGRVDYERRERGTPVERDPERASMEVRRLVEALGEDGRPAVSDVEVVFRPRSDAPPVHIRSNEERELAFALSHTIHHCAMMRGILHAHGVGAPERFGYAPSTLAAMKKR